MSESLIARAPWPHEEHASSGMGGVTAVVLDGLGLATVIVRRGQLSALTDRVRERFGIVLPHGPYRRAVGSLAFAGTGPEAWLAMRDTPDGFTELLTSEIGAMAAVADQSDGYAMLRVSGPKVRSALEKIFPLDLHPSAFKPGDVASTVASHMGATIWRLDDADGAPVFDIAVFRSLAGSFWHAFSYSAAEFGLAIAARG